MNIKDSLKISLLILANVAIGGGIYVGYEAYEAAVKPIGSVSDSLIAIADKKTGLPATLTAINDPKTGIRETLHELNSALREARKTIDVAQKTSLQLQRASREESAQLQQLSAEGIAAAKAAKQTIVDADAQIKRIGPAIDSLGALAGSLKTESAETLKAGTGTLNATTAAVGHLDAITQGPIADAAKSFAGTSAHLDGTSAHVESISAHVDDLFNPHKLPFWKNLLAKGLGALGQVLLNYIFPERVTVVH